MTKALPRISSSLGSHLKNSWFGWLVIFLMLLFSSQLIGTGISEQLIFIPADIFSWLCYSSALGKSENSCCRKDRKNHCVDLNVRHWYLIFMTSTSLSKKSESNVCVSYFQRKMCEKWQKCPEVVIFLLRWRSSKKLKRQSLWSSLRAPLDLRPTLQTFLITQTKSTG